MNTLTQLTDRFSDFLHKLPSVNKDFSVEIIHLRCHGRHHDAIRYIKNNGTLSHVDKNILLYRFYFEIKDNDLSKKYLNHAKTLDDTISFLELEESYLSLDEAHFEKCLQIHKTNFPNLKINELISYICSELFHRNHSQSALRFLKCFQSELDQSAQLQKLYGELSDKSKHDLYYYYYGDFIIVFQLVAPILLLLLSIISLYQSNSLPILFEALITLSFDPNTFLLSLQQVCTVIFFLCAFLPMIRINSKVLLHNQSTPKLCNIQINSHYLHIEEFHKVDHLDLNSNPYYVSKDDNDFSFNALIRFLPFVPNLNYIYAYSNFDQSYRVKALWGIADHFKPSNEEPTDSINMFGIRLAQIAFWIHKIKTNHTIHLWILLLLSPYLLQFLFFVETSTWITIFRNLFTLFVFYLMFYKFDKIFPQYIKNSTSNSILKVKVIQPTILIIAFIYFYQIFSYFEFLGLIPSFLCTCLFYLIFLPNKMCGHHKEVNAIASQLLTHLKSIEPIIQIHHNCSVIQVNHIGPFKKQVFLIYDNCLAVSKNVFGFHLYFKQLIGPFTVTQYPTYSSLSSFDETIKIAKSDRSVSSILKQFNIPFLESYKHPPIQFYKHRGRVIIICLLFGLWEVTKWSLFSIGSPNEQNISKNLSRFIGNHFYYSGGYYTHKVDPVPYQLGLSKDKKRLVLHQARVPTYLEYETLLKKTIKHHPNVKFTYPPKIKPYRERFELFGFLKWHSYDKNKLFPSKQYSSIYKDYCKLVNSHLILYQENLICGRQYELHSEIVNNPQLQFVLPKHLTSSLKLK